VLKPVPEDERSANEVAITLSFDMPGGKARRRTPDNSEDFKPCTLRFRDGAWTSEPAERGPKMKLAPMCEAFYRALLDALAISDKPGETTRTAWYAECVRTGLAEPVHPDDGWEATSSKHAKFRKYMAEIKAGGLIGVDGERVIDLRKGRKPC
jgi:hypothetical protein